MPHDFKPLTEDERAQCRYVMHKGKAWPTAETVRKLLGISDFRLRRYDESCPLYDGKALAPQTVMEPAQGDLVKIYDPDIVALCEQKKLEAQSGVYINRLPVDLKDGSQVPAGESWLSPEQTMRRFTKAWKDNEADQSTTATPEQMRTEKKQQDKADELLLMRRIKHLIRTGKIRAHQFGVEEPNVRAYWSLEKDVNAVCAKFKKQRKERNATHPRWSLSPTHAFDGRFPDEPDRLTLQPMVPNRNGADVLNAMLQAHGLEPLSLHTIELYPNRLPKNLQETFGDKRLPMEKRIIPGTVGYKVATVRRGDLQRLADAMAARAGRVPALEGTAGLKTLREVMRHYRVGGGRRPGRLDALMIGALLSPLAKPILRPGAKNGCQTSNGYDLEEIDRMLVGQDLLEAARKNYRQYDVQGPLAQAVLAAVSQFPSKTSDICRRIPEEHRPSRRTANDILGRFAAAGKVERNPPWPDNAMHKRVLWHIAAPAAQANGHASATPGSHGSAGTGTEDRGGAGGAPAKPTVRADSSADKNKKNRRHFPTNPELLELARRIRANRNPQKSKNEIALEYTDGDATRANSLLRQLRRYPDLIT